MLTIFLGYYAYMEASNRRQNDSAILISRVFELSSNHCFSLWYNANGKDIGSLLVKDYNAIQFISTGHRKNVWRKAQILLGYGSHQVSLRLYSDFRSTIKACRLYEYLHLS